MNLEKLLKDASEVIVTAGKKLVPHYGNIEHETKLNAHDVVTKLDKQTEQEVGQALLKLHPQIGFKGEEFGFQKEADTYWLCDPIDGTMQFIRGIPMCTNMLALVHEGSSVIAIINNFITGDIFTAIEGSGSFLNEKPIHVSDRPIEHAMIALETNMEKPGNAEFRKQLRQRAWLPAYICSGYEFGLIASGKLEGKICKDPYGGEHDFASGTLLVKEAGGVVANIGKTTYELTDRNFIAANQEVYKALTKGDDPLLPIV